MQRLHDINFELLHRHVLGASRLTPAQFPPLQVRNESFRLVAIDAEPYNKYRVFEATDRKSFYEPSDRHKLPVEHGYYQLSYAIERDGLWLGDVSIQLERGSKTAWVSAWDAAKQEGIALGQLELPAHGVLQALQDHVSTHPQFLSAFDIPDMQVNDAQGVSRNKGRTPD